MSAKTGKRPLRSLSAHEKLEAIRRVHDGESKASVARDIGVPESTLRGWCKNEDKISFLSRQSSSPEADDVVEPKEKRTKLDEAIQPFNLSLKHSTSIYPSSSQSLYTPLDFSKSDSDTAHKTPQNLSLKIDTPKSSATTVTPTTTTAQMTDQELRRAELARLSIELGLNRPEMFPSSMNNTSNTISDLTQNLTLINAWNSLMMQQQLMQNGQTTKKMTNSEYLALANTLIQSIPAISSSMSKLQQSSSRLPKEQQQQPTADDYIKSWLKIQEAAAVTAAVAANHANNSHNKTQMVSHNISTITTTILTTTTTTTPAVTTVSPPSITATTSSSINNNNINTTPTTATTTNLDAIYQNSLWKWNKELTQNQLNALMNKQQTENHKPILYQQLTKDACDDNSKDNVNGKKVLKNPTKIRSILDNLLINNNHIEPNNKQNNHEIISRDEALKHGEKFMQWLESYSDPMVTAVQLTQFKNLLNNIRLGANRQNGDTLRNKTKERRK